jgi:Zn-dependent protease
VIPRKGFRIGSFKGIDVYLHWSWFIVFFLLLWVIIQFFQQSTSSPPSVYIPLSLITTLLFFLSVLLHELSHSVVANRNDIPIRRITLFVFGGVAQMSRDVTSPRVEFKMAVAGPLCSYVICMVFGALAFLAFLARAGTVSFGLALISAVNFGLGTFNLVPGFPLDGGRILRALLWHRSGDLEKSTRIASRLGQGLGSLLILSGVIMLLIEILRPLYDLTLAGFWFILIGAFLVQAAYNSYNQVRLRGWLSGLRVEDLTRFGVPAVDTSTTLEEVYRLHLERSPHATVPVLRQGRLTASINLSDLRSVEPSLWPHTPAGEVARLIPHEEMIGAERPLYDAVLLMNRLGGEYLWVVDDGRLLGIITREDARGVIRQAREKEHGQSGP